jgi:hypothetical protein
MKRAIEYLLCFVGACALFSCTNFREESVDLGGVSIAQERISLSPESQERTLTVQSGEKWTISSMPGWIKVQSIDNSRSKAYIWSVLLSVTANDDYDRSGEITFQSRSSMAVLTVEQVGWKGPFNPLTAISLSRTSMEVAEGESKQLYAIFTPSNASNQNVTWKSDNTSVATVSSTGQVTGVKEGNATITVTTEEGGKTATCNVTVKRSIPVTSVSLDKTELTLMEGASYQLSATVNPSEVTNKNVSWKSSDTSVATVSSTGLVTAVKLGTATITVTTENGSKTAYCSVLVHDGSGYENDHEWVDLGLTVKWATCNVGASSPEEYGNYYAWGEISTKNYYSWEDYKFRVSGNTRDNVTFSKYNTVSGRGTEDNRMQLDYSDDAACANWGGKWRMPSDEEFKELMTQCDWTWITSNGTTGYVVKSRKNGKSIFLPAAGVWRGSSLDEGYSAGSYYGFYWSSSLYADFPWTAFSVGFDLYYGFSRFDMFYIDRDSGLPIRPVTE